MFSIIFLIFVLSTLITFNKSYNERYFKNLFNSFGLLVSDNENKISLYDKNNKMRKIYIYSEQHEAYSLLNCVQNV